MKKLLLLFTPLMFFFSCYIPNSSNYISNISYEKTPALLIKQSVRSLNTVDKLKNIVEKSDKIIIASIEHYETLDSALIIAIEDEIIKEFVISGYSVLERDAHTLQWLKNERDIYESIEKDGVIKPKSELISGDKIISYRIIESGIIYKENPSKPLILEREARTILEIRVVDIKTSKVLLAVKLDGKANDRVQKKDALSLENFSYKHYQSTLPVTYGSKDNRTILEKKDVKNKSKKTGLVSTIVIAIGWITTLGIFLA